MYAAGGSAEPASDGVREAELLALLTSLLSDEVQATEPASGSRPAAAAAASSGGAASGRGGSRSAARQPAGSPAGQAPGPVDRESAPRRPKYGSPPPAGDGAPAERGEDEPHGGSARAEGGGQDGGGQEGGRGGLGGRLAKVASGLREGLESSRGRFGDAVERFRSPLRGRASEAADGRASDEPERSRRREASASVDEPIAQPPIAIPPLAVHAIEKPGDEFVSTAEFARRAREESARRRAAHPPPPPPLLVNGGEPGLLTRLGHTLDTGIEEVSTQLNETLKVSKDKWATFNQSLWSSLPAAVSGGASDQPRADGGGATAPRQPLTRSRPADDPGRFSARSQSSAAASQEYTLGPPRPVNEYLMPNRYDAREHNFHVC